MKCVRVDEVSVFAHYHALFPICKLDDLRVGRPVSVGQIMGMHDIAAGAGQPTAHSAGKLGIDQELHGFTGWSCFIRLSRAAPGANGFVSMA
jgi:hypothetical protein